MKILVTGWYGTETIGDRAILASLLSHLSRLWPNGDVYISSIYPFFTERSLAEDEALYKDVMQVPSNLVDKIRIVDARKPLEYRRAVISSDLVIIGGGPFDEIAQMSMLEYAFRLSKRRAIPTLVYGCGINVLHNNKYKKILNRILRNADYVVLRDRQSSELAKTYSPEKSISARLAVSIDPAVFTAVRYAKSQYYSVSNSQDKSFIAINLRDYPRIYDTERNGIDINFHVLEILNSLKLSGAVQFVPMHYFDTGGDDRIVGFKIKKDANFDVSVPSTSLNVMVTMDLYTSAKACIGMRFHSVVLQTILNGNNYILNYTDSKYGKIPGFIDSIGGNDFYRSRLINLQSSEDSRLEIGEDKFIYDTEMIDRFDEIYLRAFHEIESRLKS